MSYAKLSLNYNYSEISDYRTNKIELSDIAAFETTPTNGVRFNLTAKTTGTTYTVTGWTSISTVIFKNLDDTNYVTVTWTDPGSNANSQRVAAGGWLVLPSIAVSANIVMTANTANCEAELIVQGVV